MTEFWKAPLAAAIVLSASIAACDQENRGKAAHPLESEQSRLFDGNLRATDSGYLVADFQSVQFTIPKQLKPTATPSQLSWIVQWPDLQLVSGRGVPTREETSKMIWIHVNARTKAISDFPNPNPDFGFMNWVNAANLDGPHLNETLGLVEYRYRKSPSVGAIYVSRDQTYVAPIDRQRPFARCDEFAVRDQWDGRRMCESTSRLSGDVYYNYEFSEALLPNWMDMDRQVRSFIFTMMEMKN